MFDLTGLARDNSTLDPRRQALESAILFRNCSKRPQMSKPTRKVCRRLMREHAMDWRRLPPPPIDR